MARWVELEKDYREALKGLWSIFVRTRARDRNLSQSGFKRLRDLLPHVTKLLRRLAKRLASGIPRTKDMDGSSSVSFPASPLVPVSPVVNSDLIDLLTLCCWRAGGC